MDATEARNQHIKLEPCGSCENLIYDRGFICTACMVGLMDGVDYEFEPLATFLAWVVHNTKIPACVAYQKRFSKLYLNLAGRTRVRQKW